MSNVLITGVAGNIGSALASALLKRNNFSIVGVDNLSTGAKHKLPDCCGRFQFIKADANDYGELSAIFLHNQFDYVLYFAAVVGVVQQLNFSLVVTTDFYPSAVIQSHCMLLY